MRTFKRSFGLFLMVAALFAPLITTGCEIHARNRHHEGEEEEEHEHRDQYRDQYRNSIQFQLPDISGHNHSRITYRVPYPTLR